MARQLESSEEAEVLGVMEDVRGFLKRKDGQLPKYVQRKDLVQELVKVDPEYNTAYCYVIAE